MLQSQFSSSSLFSSFQSLPQKPGIYIYKNIKSDIIYVGKANNLKSRVRSYFQPLQKLGAKTAALVANINSIEHIEVNSEVEALLLESKLIKKFKPIYNIISKDDKSPYYIHITKEDFPKPIIDHNPEGSIAGPFITSYTAKNILKEFRRISPFCTAKRPVKTPCFYSHLGQCSPCPFTKDKVGYQKNIKYLKLLFNAKFAGVAKALEKERDQLSIKLEFESAARVQNHITALKHLSTRPISPDEYLTNPNLLDDRRQESLQSLHQILEPHFKNLKSLQRIEMYDNSHLQGSNATSAMTVAINGEPNSSHYRHFTIKNGQCQMPNAKSNNDVSMMSEVLTRRLSHSDWPIPNLIVLDGGIPQLSIINLLPSAHCLVPIISLAKRHETLIIPIIESIAGTESTKYVEINLPPDHPGLRLLMRLRDEAHRFSRRLHHKHRKKTLTI